MHVYKVQNVQIGLTASSHWQEIAKYPSVIGWMEARTRSLVDLKNINMNFSWILQRGAHILREISTDLTEKFRQIQCTLFLPILSVNSCRLDDDMGVVDKTYSECFSCCVELQSYAKTQGHLCGRFLHGGWRLQCRWKLL